MKSETINNDQIQYTKIDSLTEYIREIIELRERLLFEGRSESLFFRGQNNVEWDIRPSVFRNSLVTFEDKIIQMAISRAPFEFNNHINAFEKLTKLQHYGLPTRLLDVTMNPLIALYFACQPTNDTQIRIFEDNFNTIEKDGVVYYACAYDESIDSSKIQLTSSIALKDINKDTTLKKLKEDLGYSINIDPNNFIGIIQGNYFVKSNLSNDRLIRQSGAFMLSGAITISEDLNDLWYSKVQKSIRSLNSEFNQERFIILGDAKERILEELDFCNINEATLFPELEHQMSHIKRITTKKLSDLVPDFVKFEPKGDNISFDSLESNYPSFDDNTIKTIVNKYVKGSIEINSILRIINDATNITDWAKKESVLSALVSNIKRRLLELGITNPREVASCIVKEIINCI